MVETIFPLDIEITPPEQVDIQSLLKNPEEGNVKVQDQGYEVSINSANLKIPEATAEFLPSLLGYVINFVQGPLITDTFEDHDSERRPWRLKQTEQVQALLNKNRLKVVSLTNACSSFDMLTVEMDGIPSLWNELIAANPDKKTQLEQLQNKMRDISMELHEMKRTMTVYRTIEEIIEVLENREEVINDQTRVDTTKPSEEQAHEYADKRGWVWDDYENSYRTDIRKAYHTYDDFTLEQKLAFSARVFEVSQEVLEVLGFSVTQRELPSQAS